MVHKAFAMPGLAACLLTAGCDALHSHPVAVAVMPSGKAFSDAGQKLEITSIIQNADSHRVQWKLLGPGSIGNDDDCCAHTEGTSAEGLMIHYVAAGPAGSYAIISATSEQDPSKTAYLVVQVNAGIELDGAPLPDATLGKPYAALIKTNGGTGAKFIDAVYPLPDGLTLHRDTGMLSGTPTSAGRFRFNLLTSDESTARVGPTLTASINVTP